MARMIPSTIHPDVRSGGERRVFALLREAPGTDSWVCLHSLGLARHAYKRRAEIDFLLITGKGVFVLEVKAGRVARTSGEWTYTDRYGQQNRKRESPFDQASSAMFALEKEIGRNFGSSDRLARLLFGYGVMFLDIEFDSGGVEGDKQLVYDIRDRRRPFTAYFDRLTRFTQSAQSRPRFAPGMQDATRLVDFLRGDFDAIPSLRFRADDAAQDILRLTTEQFGVLDALAAEPRCLIQGSAGTGKTVLAVESARREARERRSVLLLSFNRVLAAYLTGILNDTPSCADVRVQSVYGFFDELIRASSFEGEFRERRLLVNSDELYQRLYPEYAAMAVIDTGASGFDCLIVDEAQDMMSSAILDTFDIVLDGGLEAGRWRFFLDANNQAAVYGKFQSEAFERVRQFGSLSVLSVNCRNTKPVSVETAMLARPVVFADARADGQPVRYCWYKNATEQVRQLRSLLQNMLSEGAAPGSISVLSPRKTADCCANDLELPGGMGIDAVSEGNVAAVASGQHPNPTYCSVSSFKGIENDFIVLTDIENLSAEWWRAVIYVGMSRARAGLYVLLHESLHATYESRLRSWLQEHEELKPAR